MKDVYKIANFKRAYTILQKYKASAAPGQLEKEFRDLDSKYHRLLNNVDKCIPDYLSALENQQVQEYYSSLEA